ncbi:MAG: hypothetical protein IH820_12820 [Bacteroidetes bacterium]|nr:hypothetical protein [Bacteroidota bacterium]
MNKILKDPLVHFLVLGLGLFVLFNLVASDEAAYDSKVINVDRDALLTFVQYRSRAFQPQAAAARLDGMSEEELERLIADYVREEALHREAKALGVDKNDYIIKRRMIQSIEFITDGFVTAAVDVTDDDIADHYEANREDYYISPFVTFTHVFFDGERHSRDEALALMVGIDARTPYSENSIVAHMLLGNQAEADRLATEIDASALLVYRAAWRKDTGADRITREAAMAKAYATEAAWRIIDHAVQLFGGLGVTTGTAVERLYRDIRPLRIYEGTTEIQKIVIANQVLKQIEDGG